MGGPGSSRWGNYSKKTTVEDCLFLTPTSLKKALTYGPGQGGTINWSQRAESLACLSFTTESLDGSLAVRLRYSKTTGDEKKALDYLVPVVSSPVHLGGVRWFFLCPLMVDGTICSRQSAKLYLPPRGLYFGCRRCYGLTYRSAQESHKFDGLYTLLAANVGLTAKGVKTLLGR
jgi:hypothetical protein